MPKRETKARRRSRPAPTQSTSSRDHPPLHRRALGPGPRWREWTNPDGSFVYPTQPPELSNYGITSIVAGGTLLRDSYGPTKQAVGLFPIVIHTTRGEPSGGEHIIVDLDGRVSAPIIATGASTVTIDIWGYDGTEWIALTGQSNGGWPRRGGRGTTRPSVARARDRRTAMLLRWAAQRKRRHGR